MFEHLKLDDVSPYLIAAFLKASELSPDRQDELAESLRAEMRNLKLPYIPEEKNTGEEEAESEKTAND